MSGKILHFGWEFRRFVASVATGMKIKFDKPLGGSVTDEKSRDTHVIRLQQNQSQNNTRS